MADALKGLEATFTSPQDLSNEALQSELFKTYGEVNRAGITAEEKEKLQARQKTLEAEMSNRQKRHGNRGKRGSGSVGGRSGQTRQHRELSCSVVAYPSSDCSRKITFIPLQLQLHRPRQPHVHLRRNVDLVPSPSPLLFHQRAKRFNRSRDPRRPTSWNDSRQKSQKKSTDSRLGLRTSRRK